MISKTTDIHKQRKYRSSKNSQSTPQKAPYIVIGLLALGVISAGLVFSLPSVMAGFQYWPEYLGVSWAHQEVLIQLLISFALKTWFSATVIFFGGWVVNRSIRKLNGKPWSLVNIKPKRQTFFPPVLIYLKISCLFFLVIFLFIIFQYPLQYIVYPG